MTPTPDGTPATWRTPPDRLHWAARTCWEVGQHDFPDTPVVVQVRGLFARATVAVVLCRRCGASAAYGYESSMDVA